MEQPMMEPPTMEQRVAYIQHEIIRLSSESTNKQIFVNTFNSLLTNKLYNIDKVIIFYYYLYNQRHYLFELNWTDCIQKLIDKSTCMLDKLRDANETSCPKQIINIASYIISQTRELLVNYMNSIVQLL